jgi:hypothetical protein
VGETAPDNNCQDPKAKNRSPFILRVAYIKGVKLNDAPIEMIRERLSKLALPSHQGQCDALEISLDDESEATVISKTPQPKRVRAELALDNKNDVNGNLSEKLASVRHKNTELTKANDKLKDQVDRTKSRVRSAKMAMLVTLLAGIIQLLWWYFGDPSLSGLVLGSVVTVCSCVGLYTTREGSLG